MSHNVQSFQWAPVLLSNCRRPVQTATMTAEIATCLYYNAPLFYSRFYSPYRMFIMHMPSWMGATWPVKLLMPVKHAGVVAYVTQHLRNAVEYGDISQLPWIHLLVVRWPCFLFFSVTTSGVGFYGVESLFGSGCFTGTVSVLCR